MNRREMGCKAQRIIYDKTLQNKTEQYTTEHNNAIFPKAVQLISLRFNQEIYMRRSDAGSSWHSTRQYRTAQNRTPQDKTIQYKTKQHEPAFERLGIS